MDDIDIEVKSKDEILWTRVRDDIAQRVKNLEDSLEVDRAILDFANLKIERLRSEAS